MACILRVVWGTHYCISTRKGTTMNAFIRLLCEDSGQDMVEYGLLSALISIVAVVTLKTIGPLVAILFMFKNRIHTVQ
jgi:Flp pilus assembly pilin Flp